MTAAADTATGWWPKAARRSSSTTSSQREGRTNPLWGQDHRCVLDRDSWRRGRLRAGADSGKRGSTRARDRPHVGHPRRRCGAHRRSRAHGWRRGRPRNAGRRPGGRQDRWRRRGGGLSRGRRRRAWRPHRESDRRDGGRVPGRRQGGAPRSSAGVAGPAATRADFADRGTGACGPAAPSRRGPRRKNGPGRARNTRGPRTAATSTNTAGRSIARTTSRSGPSPRKRT